MLETEINSGIVVKYPGFIQLRFRNPILFQEDNEIRRALIDEEKTDSEEEQQLNPEDAFIADVLTSDGFEVLDIVHLSPNSDEVEVGSERRQYSDGDTEEVGPSAIELDVPYDAESGVAILVLQDGVWQWLISREVSSDEIESQRRGLVEETPIGPRKHQFRLDIMDSAMTILPEDFNSPLAGTMVATSVLKAIVLRFALPKLVEKAEERLERGIQEGFIHIVHSDPTTWRPLENNHHNLNYTGGAAKVLLLIHGTFSSTVGSFGPLYGVESSSGRRFLESVLENYDLVLGWDHKTLSKTPEQNAHDLWEELLHLPGIWAGGQPMIDVIAYSRGGLVFRSLIEISHSEVGTAKAPTSLVWQRVILVGATNRGTLLASPKHWFNLLNLYTNLVVSACRLAALISPHSTLVSNLMAGMTRGLGSFIKELAAHSVASGAVPGIAAMEPGGAFLTALEERQSNRSSPPGNQPKYYVITATFGDSDGMKAAKMESTKDVGLPARIATWIASGAMEALMKEPSDLVVNCSSMEVPGVILTSKERLDFAGLPPIYHTIYFAQDQTGETLLSWLLPLPAMA